MPQRRTKHSAPTGRGPDQSATVSLADLKNIAAPPQGGSEVVTLRLSGAWRTIWQKLRDELPGVSDAEILRQAIALRAALVAVDSKGKRPEATISFHDQTGQMVTVSLEEHIGIKRT